MRDEVARHADPSGRPLQVRIGIDTGPVVAGVIGTDKFAYDLWGDTVNTASRMESQGVPSCIQVTERTYQRLRDRYWFQERGPIQVKGMGELVTWFLLGRKP
jgi:class 3 adenylate cyclase